MQMMNSAFLVAHILGWNQKILPIIFLLVCKNGDLSLDILHVTNSRKLCSKNETDDIAHGNIFKPQY